MKKKSIDLLNKAIADELSANSDSVSKKIFESLVEDEERHYNQYDDEIENMKKFGANYLALQSIERSKATTHNIQLYAIFKIMLTFKQCKYFQKQHIAAAHCAALK